MKFYLNIVGFLLMLISCSPKNISEINLTTVNRKDLKEKFEEKINWSKDRKLKWSDFKAMPPIENKETAAVTNCGFGFRSKRTVFFGKPQVTVSNIFYPQMSWVRIDQINRDLLLEHEQLHFDISEVYARKLKHQLTSAKLNYFNMRKRSESIFNKIYAEYLQQQQDYEHQTEYSLNIKKQKEWIEKIGSELKAAEK